MRRHIPLWSDNDYADAERDAAEATTRYARSAKPTVRLRRPTCTELLECPALIAQLVLAVSAVQ